MHNIVNGTAELTCTSCMHRVIRLPYTSDLEWKIVVERFRSEHGGCSCGSESGAHLAGCPMCPVKYS
jgi:hypothetical protein